MGYPVGMLKAIMSGVEFIRWQTFLRQLPNLRDKQDWYLAAIVAQLEATRNRQRVTIADKLLDFDTGLVQPNKARRTLSSVKSRHFAALGDYAESLLQQAGIH